MGIRVGRSFLAIALAIPASVSADKKPETSHLTFVREVIRELSAVEDIRSKADEDLRKDSNATFSNMIHTATLFKLELGSQISMLNNMNLGDPYETLIPTLTAAYGAKIKIWERMKEIGGDFIGGPREGVNYQKIAAELPELRANLDYIDETIFHASPLVFATLIDMKADSKGHANHLVITKAERSDLIEYIKTAFGKKLDEKEPTYTVAAAKVVKGYLEKDYKCADEPWE
jgi:hypothetical protein